MARLFNDSGGILLREALNAYRLCVRSEMHIPDAWVKDGVFTAAERRVIPFVLKGAPNKEIAVRLDMAMTSVKLHVRTLCRKLGVTNRTQAAIALHQMMGQ